MRKAETPAITPHQARYILEKLVEERKVTAADVRRHIAGMWVEMNALERRIAELRDLGNSLAHPVRSARSVARKVKSRAKRVSAEVAASRKLQGQYIAAIRQVPKNQRAKYAAIAKEKGREAAIREIKKASR